MSWYSDKQLRWVLIRGAAALCVCLTIVVLSRRLELGHLILAIGVPFILTIIGVFRHFALKNAKTETRHDN